MSHRRHRLSTRSGARQRPAPEGHELVERAVSVAIPAGSASLSSRLGVPASLWAGLLANRFGIPASRPETSSDLQAQLTDSGVLSRRGAVEASEHGERPSGVAPSACGPFVNTVLSCAGDTTP